MENQQEQSERIYFTIGEKEIKKPQLLRLLYAGSILGLILGVWLVVGY